MKTSQKNNQSLASIEKVAMKILKAFSDIEKSFLQACEDFFLATDKEQTYIREKAPLKNWGLIKRIGSGEVNPDLYEIDGEIAKKLISAPRAMQDEAFKPLEVVVINNKGKHNIRKIHFTEMTYSQGLQVFDFQNGHIRTVAQQRTFLDAKKKQEESRLINVSSPQKTAMECCIVHKDSKTVEIKGLIFTRSMFHSLLGQLGD